ncbi:hypothetical protein Tco_0898666 [Tanacetum coccineum]
MPRIDLIDISLKESSLIQNHPINTILDTTLALSIPPSTLGQTNSTHGNIVSPLAPRALVFSTSPNSLIEPHPYLSSLTKRKRDDHDKDPSPNADKDSKKRQKKPDSSKDDKDQAGSSKQGKSSSKPSKFNKPVDADEVIQDVETDTRECVEDAVCDSGPTAPVINKTKWFKKSPRPATPESPDPDWSKDQNADI